MHLKWSASYADIIISKDKMWVIEKYPSRMIVRPGQMISNLR